jgi:8-oxo-dGTP diphosphatase
MVKYGILLAVLFVFICYTIKAKVHERNKKPKGSISFATVLLINDRSEVLLLRRKDTGFADGLYALPGGKIETGETALEAAQRECQEEVGLLVEDLSFVHVVNRQGPETEFYVFVFKAEKWQGTPSNCEPTKSDDVRWFSLHTLPENIIPAHKQAIVLSQQGILYSEHGWN